MEQLAANLKVSIDNKKALLQVIEQAFCLESGQISLREIEILTTELKEKGIDAFVKQFSKFANLGFTPHILEV